MDINKISRLQTKLQHEGYLLSIGAISDLLKSQDPTKKGNNIDWIADRIMDGGISWDSVIQGDKTVNLTIKRMLGLNILGLTGNKKIKDIKSFSELKQYVAQKRSNVLVYDDSGNLSMKMTTDDAVAKWGQDTQWQDLKNVNLKECHFIKLKNGIKLLGITTDKILDIHNNPITSQFVDENWEMMKNVMINFPKLVPDKYMTYGYALKTIRHNPKLIREIPERLRDYTLYKAAVSYDGTLLYAVPDAFKNRIMCETAVKNNSAAIDAVPRHHLDEEMWALTLISNNDPKTFLSIPEQYRTYNTYIKAVQKNGLALKHVPVEHMTNELCELAIKQNGFAFRYLPEHMQTEDFALMAIKQNGLVLSIIPEELHSYEMYVHAVNNNSEAIDYVPDEIKHDVIDDVKRLQENKMFSGVHRTINSIKHSFC